MMICLFLISGTTSIAVDVDVVAIIVVAMSVLIIIEAFDRVVLRRHLHTSYLIMSSRVHEHETTPQLACVLALLLLLPMLVKFSM